MINKIAYFALAVVVAVVMAAGVGGRNWVDTTDPLEEAIR